MQNKHAYGILIHASLASQVQPDTPLLPPAWLKRSEDADAYPRCQSSKGADTPRLNLQLSPQVMVDALVR